MQTLRSGNSLRTTRRAPWVVAVAASTALVLGACTGAGTGELTSAEPTSAESTSTPSAAGLDLRPEFREPVSLSSDSGILEVTLTAEQSSAELNTVADPVEGMLLFSWEVNRGLSNGAMSGANSYPAPTLVVQPGDQLIVHMANELHGLTIPDFVNPVLTPAGKDVPLTPDVADHLPLNLHTHGLHVSPNLNSDNVMIEFDPGQGNTYIYDIPADHPQGLYWYHPHRHQLTEQQVYRGLAGMIVIGRPEGVIPKVIDNDVPVRVMALQSNFVAGRGAGMREMNYTSWTQMINTWEVPADGAIEAGAYEPIAAPVNFPDSPAGTTFKTNWFAGPLSAENKRGAFQFMPQNLITFMADDGSANSPADPSAPDHLRDVQYTVNGQFQPQVTMAPGETGVWVIANIGSQSYMNVGVRNTATGELEPLRVLATDGNPVPSVLPGNGDEGRTYLLPSASRVAIAVTMPETGGLQLELPAVTGPAEAHTQPLETEGILYTSNGDGTTPRGVLGTVSIDPSHVNWFDGFKSTPTQVLAYADPSGAPVTPMDFALGEPLDGDTAFLDLADREVDLTRNFTIGGGASPLVNPQDPNGFMYMFDGTTWPTTPVIHPRLNSIEEWRFTNSNNDQHPLHIHVNDFEVTRLIDPAQGTTSGPLPYSIDNANIPAPSLGPNEAVIEPGVMWLRSTFTDYIGTFVTHCHRLDHEDNGLMMTVNVIPEVSTIATVEAPRAGGPAVVVVRDQADGRVLGSVIPFPDSDTLPTMDMVDIDGDAILDLLVGHGPDGPPLVIAYSGAGSDPFTKELVRFEAFEADFRGGVSVAGGLISGDPTRNNIIVSSGPGRPSEVRVYSSDLPPTAGDALALLSSFAPAEGDGGAVVTSGMVAAGRFSVLTAPTGSDEVSVFEFPLFTDTMAGFTDESPTSNLGTPTLVHRFDAFDDYDGPISLATGWVAADQGGAESIVIGQRDGAGTVRLYAWATNLDGQSAMYVEDFHQQHALTLTPTLTFTPLDGPVFVATTSTTSGANVIVAGPQDTRYVTNVYGAAVSTDDPTQLAAELVQTVSTSMRPEGVAGG